MNIRKIVLQVSALFAAADAQAQNPIIQTIYTADPAPMVYKDTVYLYTGHDEDKSTVFVMKDWRCFTSTDMVNWTDRGSPLSLKTFSWAKQDAWAGQCIPRNGKFYWYVPMTHETMGMSIGVAVSDSPTGPFKDALGKPLVHSGYGDIDPTVFIDDDGQAYLYWGEPLSYVRKVEPGYVPDAYIMRLFGRCPFPLKNHNFAALYSGLRLALSPSPGLTGFYQRLELPP